MFDFEVVSQWLSPSNKWGVRERWDVFLPYRYFCENEVVVVVVIFIRRGGRLRSSYIPSLPWGILAVLG